MTRSLPPRPVGKIAVVGLRNNRYFCYLNSVIQCILAVDTMRDHFVTQKYAAYKDLVTRRDSFDFCNAFFRMVREANKKVADNADIKQPTANEN